MGDSYSERMSLESCRELLGADVSALSDDEIETIRDQADAFTHFLTDLYLDRQRQEQARKQLPVVSGSIPVWSENGSRVKSTL